MKQVNFRTTKELQTKLQFERARLNTPIQVIINTAIHKYFLNSLEDRERAVKNFKTSSLRCMTIKKSSHTFTAKNIQS
jgi:hypothetical protein